MQSCSLRTNNSWLYPPYHTFPHLRPFSSDLWSKGPVVAGACLVTDVGILEYRMCPTKMPICQEHKVEWCYLFDLEFHWFCKILWEPDKFQKISWNSFPVFWCCNGSLASNCWHAEFHDDFSLPSSQKSFQCFLWSLDQAESGFHFQGLLSFLKNFDNQCTHELT